MPRTTKIFDRIGGRLIEQHGAHLMVEGAVDEMIIERIILALRR